MKCAVGILIPDANYSQKLEGHSVLACEVATAAGLQHDVDNMGTTVTGPQIQLTAALQSCHDGLHPSEWRERLDEIASHFDLVVEP